MTRFARAQREIGLAVGEPPATRGLPAVACSPLLPRLLERAGNCATRGSITALYTVLVEGDDMKEPWPTRCARSSTATSCCRASSPARGHYPAIDVLRSVSRVMTAVADEAHSVPPPAFGSWWRATSATAT